MEDLHEERVTRRDDGVADDDEHPGDGDEGRRFSSRRSVLGVLAAGAVVAACGESKDLAIDQLVPPTTDGIGTGGTGVAPAPRTPTVVTVDVTTEPVFETGADLGKATLPSPKGAAAPAAAPSGGSSATPANDPAPATADQTSGSAMPEPSTRTAAPADPTAPTTASGPASTAKQTSTTAQNEILVVTDDSGASGTTASTAPRPPTTNAATATSTTETAGVSTTAAPTTQQPATTATTAAPTTVAAESAPTTAAPTTEPPPSNAPAAAPGVLTAETAVAKLTFGPTPGQISAVRAMGPKAFIEDQLRRTGPDGDVERQVATIKPIHMSPAELRAERIRNWWMHNYVGHVGVYRASRSRNQLFEMMGQLWMDHFNVYLDDNFQYFIPDYQENVIRRHAMGSFKELFKAVSHAPAMLHYLNNDVNDASTPETINENYGRELLELHSLGIDENNRQIYNESDVETAAMMMAGWSAELNINDPNYGTFRYRPEYEYRAGDRTLLNGAWSSAGLSGKARGDSLLEFLATHPTTARHIAYRLCRRFVSDRPSATLVNSAAQVFLANDTAIVPVLRHIFDSAEFAGSGGQKVRRPIEFQAALLRATSTTFSSVGEDMSWRRLGGYYLQPARHEPWQWELPDGYPDEAEEWIVADAFIGRWNHAIQVAEGRVGGTTTDLEPLLRAAGGSTVGELAQGIAAELGIGPLPDDVVAANVAAIGYEPDRPIADADRRRFGTLTGLLIAHPLFQTR